VLIIVIAIARVFPCQRFHISDTYIRISRIIISLGFLATGVSYLVLSRWLAILILAIKQAWSKQENRLHDLINRQSFEPIFQAGSVVPRASLQSTITRHKRCLTRQVRQLFNRGDISSYCLVRIHLDSHQSFFPDSVCAIAFILKKHGCIITTTMANSHDRAARLIAKRLGGKYNRSGSPDVKGRYGSAEVKSTADEITEGLRTDARSGSGGGRRTERERRDIHAAS